MFILRDFYTIEELGEQYRRQAEWSQEVLDYYWPNNTPKRVLDVGCGPAPIHLERKKAKFKCGVDIDRETLIMVNSEINTVAADGGSLPFKNNVFDIVFCHYLLLWVPMRDVLQEMWRVTAKGGRLICASEPDYTSRRENPGGISQEFQTALTKLGADPGAGSKLEAEFAELTDKYEIGILNQLESSEFQLTELENDIEFISKILGRNIKDKARNLINSLKCSEGFIYMPVYYGCAYKG
jgi:SAM-dependent methyltransferase